MDKMSILLPGFRKISPDELYLYFNVLRLVYRTAESAQATGALQEFDSFLTDRADIFQIMISLLIDKMGRRWVHDNGVGLSSLWKILVWKRTYSYPVHVHVLLPAIDASTTFYLLIDRDILLDCSKDLLYTARESSGAL